MKTNSTKQKEFNSFLDVIQQFPTEQTCREFFEKMRWNGHIVCPHCQTDKIYKFQSGKLYKCATCKKQFTVKVGTIFEDSALPLQKWFYAIYLVTAHKKGLSSHQLARDIKVTQKTAWHMLHRIRHAMKVKSFAKPMTGTVEADETYVGGKGHHGKRGRGSENKIAVFGIIERGGKLVSQPVKRVNAKTLKGIIRQNVSKKATIMTDEWTAYTGLGNEFSKHGIVNHGRKEYVNGSVHVNNMENFWSLLKRGITGIYHHVSPEHLHRYCDEFEYRYNSREIKDTQRFTSLLNTCEGRLMYRNLIAK
jgi:transposase-like protein